MSQATVEAPTGDGLSERQRQRCDVARSKRQEAACSANVNGPNPDSLADAKKAAIGVRCATSACCTTSTNKGWPNGNRRLALDLGRATQQLAKVVGNGGKILGLVDKP